MLYEILFAIMAVLMPIMCYLAFVKGYNLKARENREAPIKVLPKVKTRQEKAEEKKAKEEQDALRELYRDINNYTA